MYKRKIYNKILDWKNSSKGKTALLIEGARRIGKSTVAEEFAKNEYEDYILLDFANESQDVKDLFLNKLSNLDDFFRYLFVYKDKNNLPRRKSVIIFDEVQRFPKAREAIKYLVKDGRYDYIETGSLISIKQNVKDILIPSEEERIEMFPMDFEEFLWAKDNQIAMTLIRDAYHNRKPLEDGIHRKMMSLFREYMTIGGMPQAVDAFIKGETFAKVDKIKQNIIKLYEEDLNKASDKGKATQIYKSVPNQLGKNKKKFTMAELNKSSRFREYENSISFVEDSMICNECNNVSDPNLLLELSKVDDKFKFYMGDTGLLITCIANNKDIMDDNIYKLLISDKISSNLGMVFENVVAQTLRSMGYRLYFHEFMQKVKSKRDTGLDTFVTKKYEIDFLIVKNKKLCPIEVKSSDSNKHTSFDAFKEKYKLKIQDKYVVHCGNYEYKDGVTFLPMYMLLCINE